MNTANSINSIARSSAKRVAWSLAFALAAWGMPALAADQPANGREGGSLVKDFQKLNEEINTTQRAAQQLVENSDTAAARDKLNSVADALDTNDDAKAAEMYAAELQAGRGPEYWRKQREEFAQKETEFLALYDRVQGMYREARRAGAEGGNESSVNRLDELARSLSDSRGSGASNKMRAALAAAKKDRDAKLKLLLEKYPRAAIYNADNIANLPLDVVEDILVSVVEKSVEMGDAAESAHRAESFLAAFPDTIRARSKQKEAQTGVNPNSTTGKKLF